MVPWCIIGFGVVLLALSFFSLPYVGFPAWSLALLLIGFGFGLLCSRRIQFKIVAKEKGTR